MCRVFVAWLALAAWPRAAAQDADAGLCAPGRAWANCSYAVATMATRPALLELELFLRTLARFDRTRRVFVASDTVVSA
jgi:hypothetical protein